MSLGVQSSLVPPPNLDTHHAEPGHAFVEPGHASNLDTHSRNRGLAVEPRTRIVEIGGLATAGRYCQMLWMAA